jgi:hypothetical protein
LIKAIKNFTFKPEFLKAGMNEFKEILKHHFELYPLMTARDIYKLIFTSAMGPGHAVADPEMVAKWMNFEVNNLENYDDKNLTDGLCPESGLVRVNIRPFLKAGGEADDLCRIFIRTANDFGQNVSKIRKLWKAAEEMSRDGQIPVKISEMDEFFMEMESKSFPAAHHSTIYRNNYKPAYRVVLKEYFDEILPKK